jgi:ABC-type dipeptide/oligopeptide/nickel transport system permease component
VTSFVFGRLLSLFPLLLIVSVVAFFVLLLTPGDPAQLMLGQNATVEAVAQLRRDLALDQPLILQYLSFLGSALHGDLGRSYATYRPVSTELGQRFLMTAQLGGTAFVLATMLGIPLGVIAAVRRNRLIDHLLRVIVLASISLPVFWLGILLIYLFAVTLRWLPSTGTGSPAHLVLPMLALATYPLALTVRLTRTSMLEVLDQDYLRTAQAKGLRPLAVIVRHALKNAMIPIVTVMGLQIGALMSGAVLTETVFAWPGLGSYMVDAVFTRDYPVIRGCILLFSLIFLVTNLAVDILYVRLDPRIRPS